MPSRTLSTYCSSVSMVLRAMVSCIWPLPWVSPSSMSRVWSVSAISCSTPLSSKVVRPAATENRFSAIVFSSAGFIRAAASIRRIIACVREE